MLLENYEEFKIESNFKIPSTKKQIFYEGFYNCQKTSKQLKS